ncbi:MAG: Hpt domain-containing protein, partial [bacterium]
MTDEKLNETFFQDGREFLDTFAEALDEISHAAGGNTVTDESGVVRPPRDALDKGFRTIHSLKSEAAYLGFDTIASRSHQIETLLQGLREGNEVESAVEEMSRGLDDLRSEIDKLKNRAGQSGEAGLEEEEVYAEPAPRIRFSDFELSLLSEARERGERFYRVLTEVEEEETMVYPRLFLLISNLELEVNVVRTVPDLSEVTPDNREIEIFLTTAMEKENLYRIVNIDQIARIQITELDYPSATTGGELASAMSAPRKSVFGKRNFLTVDTDKLEELGKGLEEIELLSVRLEDEDDTVKRLRNLAAHCTDLARRLRLRRLAEELLRIRRFAEEHAERQGKKVLLDISGGEFEVESAFLEQLSEIMIHLVRNAVDHGIEPPEERAVAGKSDTGSILVTADKKENTLTLQIADDGRGIERATVVHRAKSAGLVKEGEPVPDTLHLLAAPGFTTLSEATDSSGRGYGLDLVSRKIKE